MSFGFSLGDFIAVIELVNKSRKKWVDAPSEYKALADETRTLSSILRDLEDVVTQTDLTPRQQDDLEHARSACNVVLEKLQELEKKYIDVDLSAKGLGAHARKAWKRSQVEPDDIRILRLRMSSSVTALTAIYNSINVHIGSKIQHEVKEVRRTQEDIEKTTVADWFAKATFAEQHTDLISRRLQGTGQWLLDSPQYDEWVSCQKPTLLCPGIPGSGKTMIASIVIDDLHTRFEKDKDTAVVYYYFDYAMKSEQMLNNVLSSCVRQLIQAQSDIPVAAKAVYQRHKELQTRVSKADELWDLMSSLSGLYSKVFFVLDAIDECRDDDLTLDNFLSGLLTQQTQAHIELQVFATSRPIQKITGQLLNNNQLEIRASPEDVRRYLDAQMLRLSWIGKHADLQGCIKDTIIRVADGMFLLAKLHFDSLVDCTKPREVRRALESLPKGSEALSQAYQKVRERIDGQPKKHRNLARRVLSFITYTERVMRITELQHALAIEPGMKQIDPEEDLDEESLLLSLCAGLVTIDPESRHVRFAHYTTQEYLQNIRQDWLPNGRIDIARSCMAYLTMDEFRCGRVESRRQFAYRLRLFPFVEHAGKLWGKYVSGPQESHIVDEVCDFLLDIGTRDFTPQVMVAEHHDFGNKVYNGASNLTPLHVTAFFGLTQATRQLIDRGCEVHAVDSKQATPLIWAARYGYVEVATVLLAQPGVGINSADEDGWTALSWAASTDHVEVVKVLLAQPGVDINSADEDGGTALSWAASSGHVEVVKVLLAQPGVDVDIASRYSQIALFRAASSGRVEVLEVLLAQPGVGVNIADQYGRTALFWAAYYGCVEVVKVLLAQPGVDINSADEDGWTALSRAAYNGYVDVVRVLLAQPGIDVSIMNGNSDTALSVARSLGRSEVVKSLEAFIKGKATSL